MKRILKVIVVAVIAMLTSNFFPILAQADGLTATFLAIPYTPQPGDFYYGSFSPVSVEIDGPDVLKYTQCSDLTNGIQNLSIVWNISGKTFQESLFVDGGYIHTIGLTKSGIKCAFSNPQQTPIIGSRGIYQFAPTEEKVAVTLTFNKGSTVLGTGNGDLLNPDYVPQAPQIVGINRGDTINGYAKFTVSANSLTAVPKVELCNLNNDNCYLGWGLQQPDHSFVVLTNESFAGQSANLVLSWPYVNSSGNYLYSKTSVIVQIGKSPSPIPWAVVKQFKGILQVQPNLDCGNQSAYSGKNLPCKISPVVWLDDGGYGDSSDGSIVNTKIEFNIISQLGTKSWKPLSKVAFPTGKTSLLNVQVPSGSWDRWIFRIDNGYLNQPQDSGIQTYGQLPVGPSINLQFPNFVMWNTPFIISAKASSGTITNCTFYMSQKVLGTVKAKSGVAKISVVAVWSGEPGTAANLYYSASCNVSGKTLSGNGYVKGFR